ncbi:MAG: hypothetical protein KKF78_11240 [Candidatus Omnitrophica bacterium]|nr:hypothetical protein [Candidatus Omnitrophota bacterium]
MKQKNNKAKYVLLELINHLPFSIFGVVSGIIMIGLLTFVAIVSGGEGLLKHASGELFHVFHPVHVLLSAVATTAMYWKHERSLWKAIIIGLLGSILICGLSDTVFPILGGIILGADMHIHICLFEHSLLVLPFAILGIVVGLTIGNTLERPTEYSHSMHVFVSSAASILYLLSYGLDSWVYSLGGGFNSYNISSYDTMLFK